MNTNREMQESLRWTMLASAAALGLALTPAAKADTVLLAQTSLISGSSAVTDSFTTPGAGTVTVQLSNLNWPTRLSSLSFAATTGSQVMSAWSWSELSSNVHSFQVGAGSYFAHITGQAAGLLNLGLYSLSITFKADASPVPLPASDWLLVGGMLVLAGASRLVGRLQLPDLTRRVPNFG